MMLKRILTGASAAAVLLLGACDDLLEPESNCVTLSNTTQSTAGDTVVTTTGLRYIETRVGTGATATSCGQVTVDYVLRSVDGAVIEDGPAPLQFFPGGGGLIPGFAQGVIGMKAGGARRLIVPPALGYRDQDRPGIPPNSTLVFDLELLSVQ